MSNYDNTNRGILFPNDRKTSDKHPDLTGKLDVNGEELEISAWKKQGKRGEFFSLSVKPAWKPDSQRQAAPPARKAEPVRHESQTTGPMPEMDTSDIPF